MNFQVEIKDDKATVKVVLPRTVPGVEQTSGVTTATAKTLLGGHLSSNALPWEIKGAVKKDYITSSGPRSSGIWVFELISTLPPSEQPLPSGPASTVEVEEVVEVAPVKKKVKKAKSSKKRGKNA